MNKLLQGDCLEVMKDIPDNSIDSVVSDPPYGISFMGKKWDYDVPKVAVWQECLRVLKPGGYVLIACGTRTQHRMAVNIEDAGFEIRDLIFWHFGSGFPKSMDISKQLDKDACRKELTERLGRKPTKEEFKVAWEKFRQVVVCSTCHGTGKIRNPNTKEWENYWLDEPCQVCNGAGTIMVSKRENKFSDCFTRQAGPSGNKRCEKCKKWLVSSNPCKCPRPQDQPVTEAAKHWEGYGTALKPACEIFTLARKPLSEPTVAANVLKWGTGGLNIDGCRVGTTGARNNGNSKGTIGSNSIGVYGKAIKKDYNKGRWPANVMHDGSQMVLDLFPDSKTGAMKKPYKYKNNGFSMGAPAGNTRQIHESSSGSAARFFYCPKASKSERNAGCEGLEAKQQDPSRKEGNPGGDNPRNRGVHAVKNNHPTVKPIALMQYLITLITPTHGTVLDPFMGSGTTGIACKNLDRGFVGIEMDEHYYEIAKARISTNNKSCPAPCQNSTISAM